MRGIETRGARCVSSSDRSTLSATNHGHHLSDVGARIALRAAILLGGTAAIALSINQPARAISINDQAAAAAGAIAN
jgi:hypothetical protein